ncbi:Transcription factor 23 [Cricetulus griseus]|uniref:Transcription factor 23 n=1 Tax=Cricetulus griseus TaxID=10029 RepID=G3GXS9_CRIGR|nr:Transcription factor 23 [Cricetulus griseus]
MSQQATGVPVMPRAGHGQTKAKALLGTDRKRIRLSRTRQDLWDDTSWSNHRSSRATSAPRGTRAKGTAHGRSEASPENAARERTRVRTLRQAFLALQAALPAVPPDTKLSKLDVLVLATSYIAHLTRTLGHELPGPAWPPFLRGLRYLHPLKGTKNLGSIPGTICRIMCCYNVSYVHNQVFRQTIFIVLVHLNEKLMQLVAVGANDLDPELEVCPENGSCAPEGPGLLQCVCADGFHGYKCMRQGSFSLLMFFGILGSTTLAISILLWGTQRRKAKAS